MMGHAVGSMRHFVHSEVCLGHFGVLLEYLSSGNRYLFYIVLQHFEPLVLPLQQMSSISAGMEANT